MHEFSMCQTIVNTALVELKKHPAARLKKVRVVVGRRHAVVPGNLRFAYEVLTRDTPAEGSVLAIRTVPVTGRCRRCGWRGRIQGFRYLCSACEHGDLEITGGNELYLESLEVETHEPSHD